MSVSFGRRKRVNRLHGSGQGGEGPIIDFLIKLAPIVGEKLIGPIANAVGNFIGSKIHKPQPPKKGEGALRYAGHRGVIMGNPRQYLKKK